MRCFCENKITYTNLHGVYFPRQFFLVTFLALIFIFSVGVATDFGVLCIGCGCETASIVGEHDWRK